MNAATAPVTFRYLQANGASWRKQLYLKGRNMSVGQLIGKMRANDLTPQEAAYDMNLPLAQVLEAEAYFHAHRALIESESEQERVLLKRRGVTVEPSDLS